MEVLALVDHSQAARIRHALSADDTFTQVSSWEALFARLACTNPSTVIVNPAVGHSHSKAAEPPAASVVLQRLRNVPFVVYSRPTNLRSAKALLNGGAVDVLLEGHTDSPNEIREVLRSAQPSTPELILRELLRAVADEHAEIATLFTELFQHPTAVPTAAALKLRTSASERSLYRWAEQAGLAPIAIIVHAARAARAFDLMRQYGFSLEHAAHTLGYSSARQLSVHLRQITRLDSVASSIALTQREFLEAVVKRLFCRNDAVPVVFRETHGATAALNSRQAEAL